MINRHVGYLLLLFLLIFPSKSHARVEEDWHFDITTKDSLLGGVTYTSPALRILWDQSVEIIFANTLRSGDIDSLTQIDIRVAPDSTNWSRPYEFFLIHNGAGTISILDSLGTSSIAVVNDPIAANTALNAQGPLCALLFPKLYGAALPAPDVGGFGAGSTYLQFRMKPIAARGRFASGGCTNCAVFVPNIRIRALKQK